MPFNLVDYTPSILTISLSFFILLFLKKTKLTLLITFMCTTSLLMVITYTFTNHFSRDGFNVAAIIHLKFLFNKITLIQFYKEGLIATISIIIAIVIANKAYKTQFLPRKISPIMQVTLLGMTLFFSTISIIINPLTVDVKNLATYYYLTKKDPLPKEFSNIDSLILKHSISKPSTYKNFIIIFAESLESTFFKKSLFPDLTTNLDGLIQDFGIEIDGIKNIEMTNWTYTGIEAALCGSINLKDNIKFSKKIKCIGNILEKDNYHLSFIGGSNFAIESKSSLLKTQGFDNIFAFDDIADFHKKKYKTKLPTQKWGAFDQSTFEFANAYLSSISEQNIQRQGLVLLTVDTHAPGYISPQCKGLKYKQLNNTLLDSIKCADLMISSFIKKHIDDYDIFLISDHLYPGSFNITQKINYDDRSLMFTHLSINHSNIAKKINRLSTNLDIAPSILNRLGYQINNLNFGRNLFNNDQQTLNESIGFEALYDNSHKIRDMHKASLE